MLSSLLAVALLTTSQPPAFECRWAKTPIKIDGVMDEAAWKDAQLVDRFTLPWLKDRERPAKTTTRARLLWDRDYLYFFADMDDQDLYADVVEHDGQCWNNDVFELFFKPADDKPGYYEFQVNAANTKLDMFLPRRGAGGYNRFKSDGDFKFETKVKLKGTLNNWRDTDQGWQVEGRIPWADFLRTGGRPEVDEVWKFALCRYDYSVTFEGPELSTCAPLVGNGGANFHGYEGYAPIKFLGPKKSAALEKRTPLTTSTVIGSPEPPPPFRAVKAFPKTPIDYPVSVHPIPGSNHLLVVAHKSNSGQSWVHLLKDDNDIEKGQEAFLDLPETAVCIAFHPKFAENGYVYIGGSGPTREESEDKKTKYSRVVRYTMSTKAPFTVDPKTAQVIIEWKSDGHNGAALVFGHDGMLYVTSGDGTSDSDTNEVGQDMTTLLAKVLRIDVDRPDKGRHYSVPKDNPFVTMKDARPEIWALGLRNPWRMTVDDKTGHIWVGTNGQDQYEQAHLVQKGDNYGWSVMEGGFPFYLNRKAAPVPIVKPTIEHPHSEARSLTGGIVYYGKSFPELVGHYIYGDYSTGYLWAAKHDGKKMLAHFLVADTRLSLAGICVDTHGEILLADYQNKGAGFLHRLERAPKETNANNFPKTLTASGLFQSVKGHVVKPALVPYSVNSVLWSDSAQKARWIGLPGEEKIEFTRGRSWKFPDQTVIVKSFFIEKEEGNPASKQWIETRFLTQQKGEWFGYSYAWNEDETEGHLVEAPGRDREVVIKTKEGSRKLNWHYPSRAECMMCHSRAAVWTLGLTEAQMNKVHDYGYGVQENQLEVFERIGMFKEGYAWQREATKLADEEIKKGAGPDSLAAWFVKNGPIKGQREPKPATVLTQGAGLFRKMAALGDTSADLELRVRSYLHSNCAQCHVNAGGGNSQFQVDFNTPVEKMKLIDVAPLHDHFGIKNAKLVAPGDPDRSVLLRRIYHRGKGQMPPLATREIDLQAVAVIREWIAKMK